MKQILQVTIGVLVVYFIRLLTGFIYDYHRKVGNNRYQLVRRIDPADCIIDTKNGNIYAYVNGKVELTEPLKEAVKSIKR